MEPIIRVEKLNVVYFLGHSNEVHALKDINLEIYPGEFIIFFGPSGCGKSTLLYSAAGLETNIQGNIYVNNKNIAALKHRELERFHQKEIGMIFQAYYLIPSLTVVDNVILPQIFVGAKLGERKERALALLEHFGVKVQADKFPDELSGGQQQRVAICRSLVNDPNMLLADEPIGNLDSNAAQDVMNLLKDLNEKQKKTIILVTHNPTHLSYAHRVFYMRDGGIIDVKVNKVIDKGIQQLVSAGTVLNISRDMELLLRTYTSMSSAQVGNLLIPFKAKQIVSEVLVGMTAEDVGKVEKKVEDLIVRGVIDNDETFKFMDIDETEGGLGLDKRTAKNLTAKIKDIVKEIKLLEAEEEKMKRGGMTADSEVMKIRHYLLDFSEINIKNFAVLEIIDRAITDRLTSKIDKKGFLEKLNLPLPDGAGIDKRTVKKIAQRFELLILGKFK